MKRRLRSAFAPIVITESESSLREANAGCIELMIDVFFVAGPTGDIAFYDD
jgi:hypothetical protein